jgi:putative tryptophan/tyrosine transport system substrate-binding protein
MMHNECEPLASQTADGFRRSRGRRRFLIAGTSVALCPMAVRSQPSTKVARIGNLTISSNTLQANGVFVDAFRAGLRELGYIEGQNVDIELRAADGKAERLQGLARELVDLKLDVLVAGDPPAARALQRETSSIPIVVSVMGDPIGEGFVTSLARPGGNMTGLTFIGPQLAPKRLALLKEVLPKASRVAALWHPTAYSEDTMTGMVNETKAAAQTMAIELGFFAVTGAPELESVLETISRGQADALFVFPSAILFGERKRIVDFATQRRLPLMSMGREFVELGGLMSYGASISGLNHRSAIYVDRILKGAKAGELPVEQPTKFEMVINLGTAKKLGLTLPATLLARADELVE